MEVLKDIWASMVHGVRERTTNPLTFAFLISTCLWNYRFFLILTGDGTVSARLAAIDNLYSEGVVMLLFHTVGVPGALALSYVFLYPWVTADVVRFYRRKQVELANSVKELELDQMLSRKDSAELTRRHEKEKNAWEERERVLRGRINALGDALLVAEASPSTSADKDQSSPKPVDEIPFDHPHIDRIEYASPIGMPLTDQEMRALNYDGNLVASLEMNIVAIVSNSATGETAAELANSLKSNLARVQYALQGLEDANLVEAGNSRRYKLTKVGRPVAIKVIDLMQEFNDFASGRKPYPKS
ncbi:hypothetical protein HZ993_24120 [Rhodoferax sp. AJA081-3]|uniref:hypothetical protein n=1 Tax=Rhodoferax sp. AJA081-3 TaxID=2752316 RepID=UPI001AE0010E|nr:hypothetical protein [Rhodoferax sp. AJA081-3]QTN28276.1 hypothetical protein HZ993_24120 [Rhodoferax sp. AJA081-3]